MAVQVGSTAPPFKARAYFAETDQFKDVTYEDYRNRWLCLYFYPMAFSPLCPTEIVAFDHAVDSFAQRDCALAACSVDSHYALRAWCKSDEKISRLRHPLLSDLTKRMAMDFGVLLAERGVALRGTFLIDPLGKLRASAVNDLPVGRNVDDVLRTLDALLTGEACPCNWKKGEPTLKK